MLRTLRLSFAFSIAHRFSPKAEGTPYVRTGSNGLHGIQAQLQFP